MLISLVRFETKFWQTEKSRKLFRGPEPRHGPASCSADGRIKVGKY